MKTISHEQLYMLHNQLTVVMICMWIAFSYLGIKIKIRPLTADSLKEQKNAGLEDCNKISGHSLRIGSITQARMNGVPTHEIMAQSGHKTTQMIDRYTKLSNIRETSAAKKI